MQKIRKYEDGDLDNLLSAWENASKIAHPFLTNDFMRQERIDIAKLFLPNSETWVLELENQVVGFISLNGSEVGAIFLQPEYHGRGLGKLMMDKAQALHGDLEVEVFEKNSIGRHFYARYGFVLIEEKLHEQTGERMLRLKFTADK